MSKTIYVDGKILRQGKPPKNAVKTREVHEVYYETPEYSRQQAINASKFFERQREMNEEMEKYHG